MIITLTLSALFYILRRNVLFNKPITTEWRLSETGDEIHYNKNGHPFKEESFLFSSRFLKFLTNWTLLFEWLEYRCIETTIFLLIGNPWGLLVYLLIPIRYYA